MIDFKLALTTTVLLVDDDVKHLERRTTAMQMSGFSVVNATSPIAAISILNESSSPKIDVAVVDYDMPIMTGCLLAAYLKTRYPTLKTILYSRADEVPEDEMSSVDVFVSKSSGVASLISKIAEFRSMEISHFDGLMIDNGAISNAIN